MSPSSMLVDQGIRDELAVTTADAHPCDGAVPGNVRDVQRALAPVSERMSAWFCLSLDKTVAMICVSLWKPSGKSGRSGRSMMRQVRISSSRCRASRLKKPPGMRPAA